MLQKSSTFPYGLPSSGKVGYALEMQEKNSFFLPFRSACTTFVASKTINFFI